MLRPERRQKIMDILRQDSKVYVSQLAKIFYIFLSCQLPSPAKCNSILWFANKVER